MPTLQEREPAAEFDLYAADYDAGMDNSLQRIPPPWRRLVH